MVSPGPQCSLLRRWIWLDMHARQEAWLAAFIATLMQSRSSPAHRHGPLAVAAAPSTAEDTSGGAVDPLVCQDADGVQIAYRDLKEEATDLEFGFSSDRT